MKTRFLLVTVLLASMLSACKPAPDFSGTWTGNIATLTLTQTGSTVTGSVEGYGGNWTFAVEGTLTGNILTFSNETPLGSGLAVIMAEDGKSFKSVDPAQAFCASRKATLPDGCGFSGKWNLKADFLPEGSSATLKQVGETVTGAVLGPDGKEIAKLDSTVQWGKGWFATGVNEWGEFNLFMTSDERGFELIVPGQPAPSKENPNRCGLREGETSVYVLSFDCTYP